MILYIVTYICLFYGDCFCFNQIMAYEARTEPELHSDLCVPNVVRSQLFGARSDLSSIFADVEKRLPSIDSDFSDVSTIWYTLVHVLYYCHITDV